jgi:hypothetical protein
MRYDRDPKLHNRGLAYVCKPATHPAARARRLSPALPGRVERGISGRGNHDFLKAG